MTAMTPQTPPAFRVKRVYDTPDPDDGTRVLVDRLWPRGITKAQARVDRWPKALAPSTELRRCSMPTGTRAARNSPAATGWNWRRRMFGKICGNCARWPPKVR